MALVSQGTRTCLVTPMFTLFRYGLLPVVAFCVVVVAASIDVYTTNTIQKSTWPQTVVTVVQSQDLGQVAAEFRGTPNTFSDPRGTLTYVVDGKTYTWQGRGRDIGVTVMNSGDRINVHYNPQNPQEINTLVLLGASTGNIILVTALVFLAFYFWFFWVRRFLRRSGPGDLDGGVPGSFADRMPERLAAIDKRPMGSFDRGRGATFGKR
jgi:Protein of unknown function (DUF3592)